ncbi:MAG: peptide chain release factor 2 [Bacillota bacterium]|nr:peptide chain release factor 2 [Bacillota bacterium]MDI7249820.1 peptide chain release factor 2 [Bacillota bacterium]
MFAETEKALEEVKEKLAQMRDSLDLAGKKARIAQIEEELARPEVWTSPEQAQNLGRELSGLQSLVDRFEGLDREAGDLRELLQLAAADGDEAMAQQLYRGARELAGRVEEFELELLLAGPYDARNAIVSIHAGAGGTDAQDWASMLLRLYTRWAEGRGFKVQLVDVLPGEEAGIKNATVVVNGPFAYGYLKAEKGVHRLVRHSPFDANARRHTSFALVEVLPEIEAEEDLEIDPADLRIDTFRSSGAGGQHVNKTDSAVRITHLPTGIVVTCQNERSQHANRLMAMRVLKSRLLALREQERQKEIAALKGAHQEIAWGNQIRSYVLDPYTLVKDHRTGHERGNVQAVLDGDIDDFIRAYLLHSARQRGEAPLPTR